MTFLKSTCPLLWLLGFVHGVSVLQARSYVESIDIPNRNDIRGHVSLPRHASGADIQWDSSDRAVISPDGWVVRQSTDTLVNLTASVQTDEGPITQVFDLNVRAAATAEEFEGYLLVFFASNSVGGEKIFYAGSDGNNAIRWKVLNNGQAVVASTQGTTGLRDPFIIRSQEGDRFFMVATDLSIGSGTTFDEAQRIGSRYIEVWESTNLIDWGEQRHVLVAPDNAGNAWAPEAYYDDELGEYVVFWASSLYEDDDPDHEGDSYNRIMYATTRDFVSFTEAEVWQDSDSEGSRYDSNVLKADGVYYRFTKDDGGDANGCRDVLQESSSTLTDTLESWDLVTSCISEMAGTGEIEGPAAFKSNPGDLNGEKFYLFVDEFTGRRYIALETEDIAQPDWKISEHQGIPYARHGGVVPITAAELDALYEAYPPEEEE